MSIDSQTGAGGERRIQREAGTGGVEHFLELHGKHLGHAHAAVLRIAGQPDPAAFDIRGIGLFESGRRADGTIRPLRPFLVATAVERCDKTAGDLGRLFQNGVGGLGVDGLGQGRQSSPQARGIEHLMEDEAQIAQRGVEFRHGATSKAEAPRRTRRAWSGKGSVGVDRLGLFVLDAGEFKQMGALHQDVQRRARRQAPAGAVHGQHHTHGAGDAALCVVVQLLETDHQADVAGENQRERQGDRQHWLEEADQRQHEQRSETGDPEGAGAAVDRVHRLAPVLIALGHGRRHSRPQRAGQTWVGGEEGVQGVADGGHQVDAINVVLDHLVGTQLVGALHQRLADDDVAEGDHIGDYRGGHGQHEHVQTGETDVEGQVVPHLAEGRRGDAPFHVGHLVLAHGDADEDGDQHAWHHAVVDDLAGEGHALGQALERHREHQVQADQAAQHQGDRRVGQAPASVDLADQRSDAGADDDAALHRIRDQPHQRATQAGDAEKQKDHEHQKLQGEQRLDRLWARLIVTEKQQYHRDAGGDPAGHQRHAKQRRQHETDAAHHHVGQSHVVGQAECTKGRRTLNGPRGQYGCSSPSRRLKTCMRVLRRPPGPVLVVVQTVWSGRSPDVIRSLPFGFPVYGLLPVCQ
ncbi:hypothetical protein L1887_62886 [Cichorium endivia]|nr:hypothetical protein L1887_62886 [Cichorium endivia]